MERFTCDLVPRGCIDSGRVSDHDESGRDADSCLQELAGELAAKASDSFQGSEPGPNCVLGVVLIRPGVAEIREEAIGRVLGNEASIPLGCAAKRAPASSHQVGQVFRIQARCNRPGLVHAAGHDREMPPLERGGPHPTCKSSDSA